MFVLPGHAATVTDGATGLQWDACAWGQVAGAGMACEGSPTALTWRQALAAARAANAALYQSHADWRVPNRTELESTVVIAAAPAGDGGLFWSSTSYQGNPARAWMVDFGDGASHPGDKSGAYALRLVRGGELTLSASGESHYARYGQTIDAILMLANTGESTQDSSVWVSLSAAFDATRTQLTCVGAGAGASCVQDGADPLHFSVILPADRSLTWRIRVPIRDDAQGASAILGVTATGTTPASDTRTLVLFRNGFDSPYADGAQ
ncbi:MAG TPA: DUF1566 domain-containing protein [Rhodanobacteraceae bacterium]|nr:DUF1566 domain-containing protein [Rhodanobacteraceae bacterium]